MQGGHRSKLGIRLPGPRLGLNAALHWPLSSGLRAVQAVPGAVLGEWGETDPEDEDDEDDDEDDAAALKSTSTPQIPQLEWWREQTSTQMM